MDNIMLDNSLVIMSATNINIKLSSYQYRDSYLDKTVSWLSIMMV